jgi:selenocysteine-specific elongation factor
VIVGTAGHIDHGKTSLVKSLTGVNADRLKEERERGITVDLGFAYQSFGEARLGFVDVPGHEKLVRNMLAGATGIDHVMLVVAADDGPMPQTIEHLAILDLLGLSRGVVVVTKCDLVDADTLAQQQKALRALLTPTTLAQAPILPVSNATGAGLDALRAHLQQASAAHASLDEPSRRQGRFRLAVDRAFSLDGIGTIVTGTAATGQVKVGDSLLVSPRGLTVRVRGIHAQNTTATTGHAGQRLALHVSGVEKAEVHRGDWVLTPAAHAPTQRLDARLRVLPGEARALAHWTSVHLHVGAEDVGARVVMLEDRIIRPGQSALVRLELDRPIGALRADRFIVRDQSATRTLGGGRVLDVFAGDSRRRKAQRLAALRALEQDDPAASLSALLAVESAVGVDAARWAVLWNLDDASMAACAATVGHRVLGSGEAQRWFAPGTLEAHTQAITAVLAAHHAKLADSPGMTQDQLARALARTSTPGLPPTAMQATKPSLKVFDALLKDLSQSRALVRTGPHWHLPGHAATLQGTEKQLWERLKPWLDEGGLNPPKLSELLLRDRNLRKDQVMRTLQRLERMGQVHAVGEEYFIQTRHVLALAKVSQQLAERDANKRLNVKELREATGMSRHLSVPLVEFFDKIGFTQRDAVGRHIKRDPDRLFGGSGEPG